jgi:hypothetical protein
MLSNLVNPSIAASPIHQSFRDTTVQELDQSRQASLGCCPCKVNHNLKGTLSGSISVGQGEQGSMGGQKVEQGV